MHSYSTQKKIATYTVDKTMIQNIETFIRHDIPKILSRSAPSGFEEISTHFEDKTTIIIHDSHGEERFKSIADYKFPFFRNDITGITVKLGAHDDEDDELPLDEFGFVLRFGKEQDNCDLSIFLTDETPREKVVAIEAGLKTIMGYHKNTNWLLFPSSVGWLIIIALFLGSTQLIPKNTRPNYFLTMLITLCSIQFLIIKPFKGYCVFDCKRQRQLDVWFNWLIMGIAGFILFATVLPSLRKNLLGF